VGGRDAISGVGSDGRPKSSQPQKQQRSILSLRYIHRHHPTYLITDVLVYEPSTADLDQWYPNTTCTTAKGAAPPPQARFGHTAVAYRHSIYVFGGQGLSNRPVDDNNATASSSCGGPVSFRDLHRLDTRTMEWAVVDVAANADTPSPDARNSHTCVLLLNDGDDGDGDGDDGDDRVILFGGANERLGPQNDVWSLTLKTRVWTRVQCGGHGGVPCGREMHSACVVVDDGGDGGARRRRMYVMGGRDGDGRVCHDSWTLDLDDHTWTQLAKPPSPRCAHTTTPIRTRSRHGLYSFGGWDGRNEFYDDCTVYDMDTKLWLRTPVRIATSSSSDDDVVPRFAHALCAIDSDRNDDRGEGYAPRALIFGGVNTLSDLRDLVLVRGQQGDDG